MTLCNNFQQKWGVDVFWGVGIFLRDDGTTAAMGVVNTLVSSSATKGSPELRDQLRPSCLTPWVGIHTIYLGERFSYQVLCHAN